MNDQSKNDESKSSSTNQLSSSPKKDESSDYEDAVDSTAVIFASRLATESATINTMDDDYCEGDKESSPPSYPTANSCLSSDTCDSVEFSWNVNDDDDKRVKKEEKEKRNGKLMKCKKEAQISPDNVINIQKEESPPPVPPPRIRHSKSASVNCSKTPKNLTHDKDKIQPKRSKSSESYSNIIKEANLNDKKLSRKSKNRSSLDDENYRHYSNKNLLQIPSIHVISNEHHSDDTNRRKSAQSIVSDNYPGQTVSSPNPVRKRNRFRKSKQHQLPTKGCSSSSSEEDDLSSFSAQNMIKCHSDDTLDRRRIASSCSPSSSTSKVGRRTERYYRRKSQEFIFKSIVQEKVNNLTVANVEKDILSSDSEVSDTGAVPCRIPPTPLNAFQWVQSTVYSPKTFFHSDRIEPQSKSMDPLDGQLTSANINHHNHPYSSIRSDAHQIDFRCLDDVLPQMSSSDPVMYTSPNNNLSCHPNSATFKGNPMLSVSTGNGSQPLTTSHHHVHAILYPHNQHHLSPNNDSGVSSQSVASSPIMSQATTPLQPPQPPPPPSSHPPPPLSSLNVNNFNNNNNNSKPISANEINHLTKLPYTSTSSSSSAMITDNICKETKSSAEFAFFVHKNSQEAPIKPVRSKSVTNNGLVNSSSCELPVRPRSQPEKMSPLESKMMTIRIRQNVKQLISNIEKNLKSSPSVNSSNKSNLVALNGNRRDSNSSKYCKLTYDSNFSSNSSKNNGKGLQRSIRSEIFYQPNPVRSSDPLKSSSFSGKTDFFTDYNKSGQLIVNGDKNNNRISPGKISPSSSSVADSDRYESGKQSKNTSNVWTKNEPTNSVNQQSKIINPHQGKEKQINKLDEALSELEEIYASLNLEDDVDLLDRAERRDMPSKFQLLRCKKNKEEEIKVNSDNVNKCFAKKSSINGHLNKPSSSECNNDLISGYKMPPEVGWCHPYCDQFSKRHSLGSTKGLLSSSFDPPYHQKAPPRRRSAIPDPVNDDLATRKMYRNPPSSATVNSISENDNNKKLPSYLLISPYYTPSNDSRDILDDIQNLPDLEKDDLSYRKHVQADAIKVSSPHPPFGIPIGVTDLRNQSNYVDAQLNEMDKNRVYYRVKPYYPHLVKDDLAFRAYRKDLNSSANDAITENGNNKLSPVTSKHLIEQYRDQGKLPWSKIPSQNVKSRNVFNQVSPSQRKPAKV